MKKISIIFWSGTGNTEQMAQEIAQGSKSVEDVEVQVLFVGKASKEAVENAHAVALGCPSMGAEELEEEMEDFVASLSDINWENKNLLLFGSYDWGDGEWMRDWQKRMKAYGANLIEEGLIIQLTPEEDGINKCRQLGRKLAQ